MPVTKSALLRYKIIDRCLRNKYRPFPGVEDLRQACEDELFNSTHEHISRSTIEKDIHAMRSDAVLGYEAPIAFHKTQKGYYYSVEGYSIQELPLNDEELQAIRFASQTLYQFRETPFFRDFYTAIDKIFSRVEVARQIDERKIPKFIQFENEPVEVQLDHLPVLLKAVTESKKVSFEYHKFDTKDVRQHLVEPLLLKEYRSRWYLAANNPGVNDTLVYSLDRIRKLVLLDESFRRPADFDPDNFFRYSLGITTYNHAKPLRVVLLFHPSQADYLKAKPVHASQKILQDTKNGFKIELLLHPTFELEMLILGYGELVKVLSPASLVKNIRKRMEKAMKG
jgi:predicted DNA-binding transcriptional regulator YafY